MPRVTHVKCARQDNPVAKKGEPYYWWKFRYGGKRYSKTYPRASRLTQSDFLSRQLEYGEELEDLKSEDYNSLEDLSSKAEEIISGIRELGEEQSDKQSNMPDSLQYSETGELLEQRAQSCEDWAGELEGIDLTTEHEFEMFDSEEEFEQAQKEELDQKIADLQACEYCE